jgi:alpha-mannosidase
MEFLWKSPDGSEVLASLMAFWYNNAQRFPEDTEEAVAFTKAIMERMAKWAHVPQLLLMNGVDHLEAQDNLSGILKRANEKLGEDKLVHSTLPAYIDALKEGLGHHISDVQTVDGELREDRGGSVLAGTLSSRMYIKQANEKTQTSVEKYAEPASSFAWMLGKNYPQGELTYAWKLLMQNHPHDSICGCSLDQVHYEMMPRFDQVQQIADELTLRSLQYVAGRVKTEADSVLVYNPLNWVRTDKVRAVIDFQIGDPTRGEPSIDPARVVPAIELHDSNGNTVPFTVVDTETLGKRLLSPIELPLVVMTKRFIIEFIAEDVPACGYKTYRVFPAASMPNFDESLASGVYWDNTISNESLRLNLLRGLATVESVDIETGEIGPVISNANIFEDVGDNGDEYLYIKPAKDQTITSLDVPTELSLVDHNPISATYKLEMTLRLPKQLAPDGRERVEERVDCPITTYMTVTKGVPRVDFVTEIDNRAKDHRIRVLFPSGINTDVSHAEGQFDVLTRPITPPAEWIGASPFYPQQRWVDVNDGEKGLCVINKGLPEYQVYNDEARTVALTLLRCVGRLSGGSDLPAVQPTPDAQCIGNYKFEYSMFPHSGTWQDARVWTQAHQHNIPLMAVQTSQHDGDLPEVMGFAETSVPELVISAVKKAEDQDMLVVRFYNITDETITGGAVRVHGAKSAKLLNMNEEVQADLAILPNGSVVMDVPAKKIVTVGFGF